MTYESVQWDDVEPGSPLPAFDYHLSLTRMVAMVRATGLYDFVHFDRDYARAAGVPDAFMSTPHAMGLFGRLLGAWGGPGADIRSLTIQIRTQSLVDDVLRVSGQVGQRRVSDSGEQLVDIDALAIENERDGIAVSGSAVLALAPRPGHPGAPAGPAYEPETSITDETPDFARALIGHSVEARQEPAQPLTAHEIHLWCEALEDWNPLYWDLEYAATARYGGIIAPPMGMFLGPGSAAPIGIGYQKPGTPVPDALGRGLRGLSLMRELRQEFTRTAMPFLVPGCPEAVLITRREDYFRPLRPGDTTTSVQRMLGCSGEKKTRLGRGFFLTWVRELRNQHGELTRTITSTAYQYHV